jgi:hypothetical protein
MQGTNYLGEENRTTRNEILFSRYTPQTKEA